MLAILAALCFLLAFFGVDLDGHSLVALGLALLALHFAVGDRVPSLGRTTR